MLDTPEQIEMLLDALERAQEAAESCKRVEVTCHAVRGDEIKAMFGAD